MWRGVSSWNSKEDLRILDGTIDMAFCRKVDDVVEMFFFEKRIDEISVANIAFHELEVLLVHDGRQRFHVTGISKRIQTKEFIIRIFLRHDVEVVSSDEASSTSYQEFHIKFSFLNVSIYRCRASCQVGSLWNPALSNVFLLILELKGLFAC